MMDPLQELWDLLLEFTPASLIDSPTPALGNPGGAEFGNNPDEHPVTQQRRAVDAVRGQGYETGQAHEKVYGEVNLSDTAAMGNIASSYGRVQDDGGRNYIKIENGELQPSIMAQDHAMGAMINQTNVDDLRTPSPRQIPDAIQQGPDASAPMQAQEQVEIHEELDYNFDVAYLQKYGRA